MKKFTKVLALALVCTMAIVALAACGSKVPNKDIDQASTNLKSADYTVTVVKSGDPGASVAFGGMALLYGCEISDIEATLTAISGDKTDSLTVIWCKSDDVAKTICEAFKKQSDAYEQEMKAMIEEMEAEIKDMEDGADKDAIKEEISELKSELSSVIIGVSGNMVFAGSKSAIAATK